MFRSSLCHVKDPQEEFSYIPPEVIYSQPGNVEDYNTPGDNAGDNDDDDVELQLPVPGPAETILIAPSSINR